MKWFNNRLNQKKKEEEEEAEDNYKCSSVFASGIPLTAALT